MASRKTSWGTDGGPRLRSEESDSHWTSEEGSMQATVPSSSSGVVFTHRLQPKPKPDGGRWGAAPQHQLSCHSGLPPPCTEPGEAFAEDPPKGTGCPSYCSPFPWVHPYDCTAPLIRNSSFLVNRFCCCCFSHVMVKSGLQDWATWV